MTELVIKIISIIIAVVTLIITLLKIYRHNVEARQKQQDNTERIFEELDGIKRRLDEHNHYAEKFGDVTEHMSNMDTTIALMQKDIEYLRKGK